MQTDFLEIHACFPMQEPHVDLLRSFGVAAVFVSLQNQFKVVLVAFFSRFPNS